MVARRFDQYGPGGVILPLGGAGVSAWPPAGGGSDDGGGQRISGTNLSSVVALAPRKRRAGGETYVRAGDRCLPLEETASPKSPSEIKPQRAPKARRGGSNRKWMQN